MNELSSLLKRSLEGQGCCAGDYEDAAAAVVWLESRGMGGLDALASSSSRSSSVGSFLDLVSEEPGALVLDANDSSLFFCGRTAVDVVCAAAATGDGGRIEIRRCHDRQAILASLALCAARGFDAIAHWSDKDCINISSIDALQPAPDFWRYPRPADDNSSTSALVMVCSSDRRTIDSVKAALVGDNSAQQANKKMFSTEMQACYNVTVKNGLSVDGQLISKLSTSASVVLVEATEQSRLGAGE